LREKSTRLKTVSWADSTDTHSRGCGHDNQSRTRAYPGRSFAMGWVVTPQRPSDQATEPDEPSRRKALKCCAHRHGPGRFGLLTHVPAAHSPCRHSALREPGSPMPFLGAHTFVPASTAQ